MYTKAASKKMSERTSDGKFCPILTVAKAIWSEFGFGKCTEDYCAWWDNERDCCAIHTVNRS